MKYATILFDLDGTLLNTIADITVALNFAAEKMNVRERFSDSDAIGFIGCGVRVLIGKATDFIGLDPKRAETFFDLYCTYYSAHNDIFTAPFDGVKETLKSLKNMGYSLGVISNKPHKDACSCVRKYFPHLFDFVIGGKDGMPHKPDPRVFDWIDENHPLDRKRTLYVGDMDVDIRFARNVGMDVAICLFGYGKKETLTDADLLLENFGDLLKFLEVTE